MEEWTNEPWAAPDYLDDSKQNVKSSVKVKKEEQSNNGDFREVRKDAVRGTIKRDFNSKGSKQALRQRARFSKLSKPIRDLKDKWKLIPAFIRVRGNTFVYGDCCLLFHFFLFFW